MTEKSQQFLMKDGLDTAAVERICDSLLAAGAEFPPESFKKDAHSSLAELELKQRVHHLIAVMGRYLPSFFPDAAKILGNIRNHWPDTTPRDEKDTMFAAWPIIDYVAEYGINHPKIALPLLRYLTPLFSAEFAIRPFLNLHAEETYNTMLLWCLDSDPHVRRLASEGIRPRLPWGKQLSQYIETPLPVISLLENLKDDPSDYVRRSVANNLNDISKDHPDLVIQTCQQWLSESVSERQWVIRHATRTLVKSGHPAVFKLLGYTKKPQITIDSFGINQTSIKTGDTLALQLQVTSTSQTRQKVVIDYAVYYLKANGTSVAKVFKWKNLTLSPQQQTTLHKLQSFKKTSTRKLYSGAHSIEILINGKKSSSTSKVEFTLFVD